MHLLDQEKLIFYLDQLVAIDQFPKAYVRLIANAADVCMQPWKHAVVHTNTIVNEQIDIKEPIELVLRIECRSAEGERYPMNDLDLEIYRSGIELNLMLGWSNQLDRPILWQGQHSVWMDANTGIRCKAPSDCVYLEALARRLRALFCPS